MTRFSKYETEEKAERDARIQKLYADGVSLRELADRFGLSKTFVSKIVSGKGTVRRAKVGTA